MANPPLLSSSLPLSYTAKPTPTPPPTPSIQEKDDANRTKGLGEAIFAVCRTALAIILTLTFVRVTGPLAFKMVVYMKTPWAVVSVALAIVNVAIIYYLAVKILKHLKNGWNILTSV